MEPQRRLRLHPKAALLIAGVGFVFSGCGSAEPQEETTHAAPGVDPFCDTRPKIEFCEDFDTQGLPGAFEDQRLNASTMTLNSDEASSAPRSLRVSVEAGGYGELRHAFEPGGKLRLFGMLYLPELGEGEVEIGSFGLGVYRVGFGVSEDGSLWVYEGDQRIAGQGTIPVGRWASFRWDVNVYGDGTGTANLRFGNDVIVDTDTLSTPTGGDDAPVATVGLSRATGSWAIHFDNLTIAIEEASQ